MTVTRSVVGLALMAVGAGAAYAGDKPELSFSADARYRNEFSLTRPGQDPMRWRQRMRARLGATATIFEELEIGLRLRTGNPDDPNSPHVDMGSGFNSYTVAFDRVYLKWAPGRGDSFAEAGKFDHPFYNGPVYGDFLWDADVQPEGVAGSARVVGSDGVKWDLRPAAYLTVENGGDAGDLSTSADDVSGEDGYLLAGQSVLSFAVGDGAVTLGNAFYYFTSLTPGDNTLLLADNAGNTLNDDGTGYEADFQVVDTVVGAELKPSDGMTLKLNARVVYNLGADADNLGWQLGAALPVSAGKVGIEPWGDVHSMGADTMWSGVIGDDHQVGEGYFGAVAGLKVKPTKRLDFNLWAILDHSNTASDDDPAMNSRVRLDINAKI